MILRLFQLSDFRENPFFLSRIIIVKYIVLADFAKNKNMEKISTFDTWTNPSPLEKYQNFDYFNLVILESEKRLFTF